MDGIDRAVAVADRAHESNRQDPEAVAPVAPRVKMLERCHHPGGHGDDDDARSGCDHEERMLSSCLIDAGEEMRQVMGATFIENLDTEEQEKS